MDGDSVMCPSVDDGGGVVRVGLGFNVRTVRDNGALIGLGEVVAIVERGLGFSVYSWLI